MATVNVLLVDDEKSFVAFLRPRLEIRGLAILTAFNGLDALTIVDEHHVDVVVLDIKMPGVSGIEVLRTIKQRHPLIEVILLTGHATVDTAVEGLKAGAIDYLTKPCRIDDLIDAVMAAHAKKASEEERARKTKLENIVRHPMALFDDEE